MKLKMANSIFQVFMLAIVGCGDSQTQNSCPNKVCEPNLGEDTQNCPTDCTAECNNHLCEPSFGETSLLCPADCGWKAISPGDSFTCATKNDGTAWCWGKNNLGQRGNGTFLYQLGADEENTRPTKVVGLENVESIAAGSNHACAKRSDGTLWCWGSNEEGRLGLGTALGPDSCSLEEEVPCSTVPVKATVLEDASEICVGQDTVVINNVGEVFVIGVDLVKIDLPIEAKKVDCSSQDCCVVLVDETVWCWGYNTNNWFGETISQRVANIQHAKQISVGEAYACVLAMENSNSSVNCWGYDSETGLFEATRILQDNSSSSITATGTDTCVLKSTEEVICWSNGPGIFGRSPQIFEALQGSKELFGGWGNLCATDNYGIAKCMGNNSYGQLGSSQVDQFGIAIVEEPHKN